MSVVTGTVVADEFVTSNPSTGAAADADSLPTGVLYVDGTADAATVTVTAQAGAGEYKFSVTMPTLTAGQRVSVRIAATVAGVAGAGIVWQDYAEALQTGDAFARIGAAGAGLSGVPWNAAWDAEVQSEAADALTAYGASTYAGGDTAGTTTLLTRITALLQTKAEADTAHGLLATAAALAAVAGDVTTILGRVTGAVALATSTTAAAIRSALGMGSANLDTQLDALPTAGENAAAVWDEATAGHATAGTTGAAITAAGSAGDPWSTALPGAYASGTAGNIIGNIASTVWDRLTSALTTSGSIGAYIVSKLGGTTITVTAPVASGGNVSVYIGDDYNNTDSRALDWSSASWPNLTGATSITLVALEARTTGANWSITGAAPTAGSGSQTVRFQPTAAETALLREGSGHRFQIEAVLSSGRIVTLVAATLTANADIA